MTDAQQPDDARAAIREAEAAFAAHFSIGDDAFEVGWVAGRDYERQRADGELRALRAGFADLKSEIMEALEELPRASYGDHETNLHRWLDYINDDLAPLAAGGAAAGEAGHG